MKLLQQYFQLQQEIFDYFGYAEDWKVIPLEDRTEMYWILTHDDKILYFEGELTLDVLKGGEFYSDHLYTQRFLPKWVYEAPDFTMISVDTRTDGNKFLAVFDNAKKMELDTDMKKVYDDKWSREADRKMEESFRNMFNQS